MWRNVKTGRAATLFLAFLFIILPAILVPSAIDPDLNPRIIAVSVFLLVFLVLSGLKVISLPESFRNIALTSVSILIFSVLPVLMAINTGEAIAEWLRLFIVYTFLFVSILFLRKYKPGISEMLRYISIAALIFSGFAIVQMIPIVEAILANKKFTISSDIASTLSNKNFFSEVLVLMMPALFYGLLKDDRKYKLLHLMALVFAVGFILLLASLACWVALIVSTAIVGTVAFTDRSADRPKLKKNAKLSLVFASLILFAIGYVIIKKVPIERSLKFKAEMVSKYIADPSLLEKNIVSNNNSVFDRLLMIRNSLRMISDHPFLGVGMNNWKLLYASYGVGGTEVINSGGMNFEHPHNDYLLVLSEQGIPGLILYLLFFFFVLRLWFRRWKDHSTIQRSFLLVILFAFTAFLTMSLFSYPRSRIYAPLLLMFYISLLFIEKDKDERTFYLKPVWIVLICCLCLISTIVASIRLNSEIHAKQMMKAKHQNNFARVMRESDKINRYFYPLEYSSTAIEWYRGMALFYSGKIPAALESYKQALKKTPYHLRTLNDLATAYEQSGMPDSAISFYRKALKMSPNLNDSKFNLTATYFNLNKVDSAYSVLNTIPYHELGIGAKENFVKFMSVVLAAKMNDSLKLITDTAFVKKANLYINDIPRTKKYIRAYTGKTIWPDIFADIK